MLNHSRLKKLSFSCSSPSWETKKCGTATQQFCSHWTAGSNNKHLVNCGIWAEINEQHNYSVEVLLWLENFEVTDCVLVPPGHPRQLDGFCLPFQPAFSLNRSDECFFHSAILSILSQAVSLENSSGSWQPILSGTAPSGNLVQWQSGLFVPLLLWLGFWLQGQWLKSCLFHPKPLIVTHHQVWKQDLQTDLTLSSFSSFSFPSVSYFFALLASLGSSEGAPECKLTTQAAESLDFGGLWGGGGWPLLPSWCIYSSTHLLPSSMLHSSDSHTAFPAADHVQWQHLLHSKGAMICLSIVYPAQHFVTPTEGSLNPWGWEGMKQSPFYFVR